MSVRDVNSLSQSAGSRSRVNPPKIKREYCALKKEQTIVGTGDVGKLIPIHLEEMMPGQKTKMKIDIGIQMMPFVSNVMQRFYGITRTYFVPYRLLWEDWEEFITGGVDGQSSKTLPALYFGGEAATKQTIYDYFGFPTHLNTGVMNHKVCAFPFAAYNLIYNEHIRIPDVKEKVEFSNRQVLRDYWDWDYFTRARIFQQRGISPSIPIVKAGETDLDHHFSWYDKNGNKIPDNAKAWVPFEAGGNSLGIGRQDYNTVQIENGFGMGNIGAGNPSNYEQITAYIEPHALTALGINLVEFMEGMAILRYQIANARIEPHYRDHLRIRFGVFPEDSRMQIPELIGVRKFDIIIDTIMNTGADQGEITSQAWGRNGEDSPLEYEAKEHGLIMTLMTIKPTSVYERGIEKTWDAARTRFDYPTPELANLPDTPIYTREIYPVGNGEDGDREIFGWGDIYDEYRSWTNFVVGNIRPSRAAGLGSYTLARYFSEKPKLNQEFLECKPDMNRVKKYTDQEDFIFYVSKTAHQAMPLPFQSEPAYTAV